MDKIKIKKYKILQDNDASELEDIIDKYLEKGWQPYGSLKIDAVLDKTCHTLYTQVMIYKY